MFPHHRKANALITFCAMIAMLFNNLGLRPLQVSHWPSSTWTDDGYPNFIPGTGIPYSQYDSYASCHPCHPCWPSSPTERIGPQNFPFSTVPAETPHQGLSPQSPSNRKHSEIVPQSLIVPAKIDLRINAARSRQLGEGVTFHLTLTNIDDRPIKNVAVETEFDEALSFPGHANNEVHQSLGPMRVGEKRKLELTLYSDKAGLHCCNFSVSTDGIESVWKSVCVEFQARQLEINILGPERRTVGSRALFTIKLVNTSGKPLSDLVATVGYDASLKPREASAGARHNPGRLKWILGTLETAEGVQLEVTFECLQRSQRGCVTLDVTADGLLSERLERCLKIVPATGALDVDIVNRSGTLKLGDESWYSVTVCNRMEQTAWGVRLVVEVPDSLRVVSADVFSEKSKLATAKRLDGRFLHFASIDPLPIGGLLTYRIRTRAVRPGTDNFRVRANHKGGAAFVELSVPNRVKPR